MRDNKVLQTIFWTLILASFGWTTVVGGCLLSFAKESNKDRKDIDMRAVVRDEVIVREMAVEFRHIAETLTEIKTDLKYVKSKT